MNFDWGFAGGFLVSALYLALVIGGVVWFVRAMNRLVSAVESLAASAREEAGRSGSTRRNDS